MSDMGVLSQQYQTASELARALNTGLIALKKTRLGLVDAHATEELRTRLAQLVAAVASLLQCQDAISNDRALRAEAERIPGAVVLRLRASRQGELPYLEEDLHRVAGRLRSHAQLTDEDLAVLAVAADTEAAEVFRRLTRA